MDEILRKGNFLAQVVIVFIIILMLAAFAINPTDTLIFTNAILLTSILVQMFMIDILLRTREKGGRRR